MYASHLDVGITFSTSICIPADFLPEQKVVFTLNQEKHKTHVMVRLAFPLKPMVKYTENAMNPFNINKFCSLNLIKSGALNLPNYPSDHCRL